MSVGQKQAGKSVSNRIFVLTLVIFLTISTIVGYLGYSTITKLQLDENALQNEIGTLSSRMTGLQAELNESQNNNNETQAKFSKLQSQFSRFNSTNQLK